MRHRLATIVASAALVAVIATVPAGAFADVDDDAFYADAVLWMHEAGITTGTSPGCFSPKAVVTRGQAAAFLHRLEGEPTASSDQSFDDVVAPWQQTPVAWLAETGITTGTSATTFDPDRPLTRGEFAALLHRLVGPPASPPHPFLDVVAPWQQGAVSWMAATEITTGTTPSTFSPNELVSRAELAVFLHRHRGTPEPEAESVDPPEGGCRLVVHGTGDVNFDPDYGPSPEQPFSYAWSDLGQLFATDDLTIINLECTASELGVPVPKRYNFRCPLASLGPSLVGGVDVANLANNHAGDFGLMAMLDGADNVRRAGIAPVGVGADAAAAMEGASFERNGWRIIVLGFNAKAYNPEWFAGPGRPGMASGLGAETIAAAVVAAKERADLVFVTIHWGIEGTISPHRDDITRAHAAVDAGADAVFGHHPHRLQGLEHYRGSPIFWSLGNFVWQSVARSRNTAVARVVVEPDGTVAGSLLPVVIADKGHPVLVG